MIRDLEYLVLNPLFVVPVLLVMSFVGLYITVKDIVKLFKKFKERRNIR